MKIVMIGSGYVGLVSGICFSDFGHDVVCVDKSSERVASLCAGVVPIYEPGLDDLMRKNVAAGRLNFTEDLAAAMKDASAVFIAVGTPSRRGDGKADLSYVFAAARELSGYLQPGALVVTKSTVPVGTNAELRRVISECRPGLEFHVASNPEFLREGSAIEDFMHPDRVVIGVDSTRAEALLREIYMPLSLRELPILATGIETAEMTKYASNAFLATKISFINEISVLCEAYGANVKDVARGMGLDRRIGGKFLHAGPGYGGSCFPKDTSAVLGMAEEVDVPMKIISAAIQANQSQKLRMVDKIVDLAGGALGGKTVAVLGVTFKPETDDMRDAPALVIVPEIVRLGANVVISDPQGRKEGEAFFPTARWELDPYEACAGADVVVLLTEWNQFRALDLGRLASRMREARMADLRNIYSEEMAATAGFSAYVSVGR